MLELTAIRNGREHASLDAPDLLSYRGEPIAHVHQAPPLLVHRVVKQLRAAAPLMGEDPKPLWEAIVRAGHVLAEGTPGGLTVQDHARLVTLATGSPLHWTTEALTDLASGLQNIREALVWQPPGGDLNTFRTHRAFLPGGRQHAWTPVGRVLGFIAPSNHQTVHLTWVLALAMGWSVAIRPGADDPVTPWRLALALREAGFPMDRLALLPGGHELVPAMVDACDRTVAYGGAGLERLLGGDPRVLFNGPGHSKVFVDTAKPVPPVPGAAPTASGAAPSAGSAAPGQGGADLATLTDFLIDAILHDGGRKCTCASAVLVRGEVPPLAKSVAERLRALPLLDPLDPEARVPAAKQEAGLPPARQSRHDGAIFLEPDLLRCSDPGQAPFGVELPAPWATIAHIPADADPLPFLTGSLAVTLLSADADVRERCLFDPTIRKVFVGPVPPWHSEPGAPHHGLLSAFLFTAKAYRKG